MHVPLLDLKAQYLSIKADVDRAIASVMDSQHFILGPAVESCEQAVARYCGSPHAVGVSSGSDALLACLMAENIGRGDEVITTAYSFFATAGAIARVGATPVFVDIDPVACNIDASQIESSITGRTRAIIPVHLYGQMSDMNTVMKIAEAFKLVVIEDAAQAIGAVHQGQAAGTAGHYGCFSFFPSKNLGAAGDGGLIVTRDERRADTLRILRSHGASPKYHHRLVGGNFRLDALQAAIVSAKLPHLDDWTAARQRHAALYDELFAEARLLNSQQIVLPRVVTDRHVFNQYIVRSPRRDALKAALQSRGVMTEVYYPVPMHLQQCFAPLGLRAGAFPESERAARETLALPVYPELTDEQIRYVVTCIREFVVDDPATATAARPLASAMSVAAAL